MSDINVLFAVTVLDSLCQLGYGLPLCQIKIYKIRTDFVCDEGDLKGFEMIIMHSILIIQKNDNLWTYVYTCTFFWASQLYYVYTGTFLGASTGQPTV